MIGLVLPDVSPCTYDSHSSKLEILSHSTHESLVSFQSKRRPSRRCRWKTPPLFLNHGGFGRRHRRRRRRQIGRHHHAPRAGKRQQACRRLEPPSLTLPHSRALVASPPLPLSLRTHRSAYFCVKSVFMAGQRLGEISVAKRLQAALYSVIPRKR